MLLTPSAFDSVLPDTSERCPTATIFEKSAIEGDIR
jgi:hypothetical protein